jgi:phosphatidylserine/phosphatidylglycerophosphate/cardiolipin synthase-like enzyme
MRQATIGNTVGFLMDEEYFVRLHQSLRALIALHPIGIVPVANTYVRIGMWVCHYDTLLPAYPGQAQSTLMNVIQDLDARAIAVQILLWAGSSLPNANAERTTNLDMQRRCAGLAHVNVYLQPYANEWLTRSSNHQKVVVINTGGTLEALVGGFNLGSNYFSQTNHGAPADVNWRQPGHNRWDSNLWHDTAVALKGPAAGEVEGVWVTNWNKPGNPFPPAVRAGVQPTPGPIPVTIATTQRVPAVGYWPFYGDTYETDIRDLLVAHINAATNYVYIENYALTDPAIIAALRGRLAAGVRVIVVVHHPNSRMFFANEVWSFLMFFTQIGLSVPIATQFNFNSRELRNLFRTVNNQLTTANYTFTARPTANLNNPLRAIQEFYDARIDFQHNVNVNQNGSFRVRDITGMVTPNAVMFAPRRGFDYGDGNGVRIEYPYVHAKLAFIDDRVAFVGSSNWTHRSMVNDGEISAIIESRPAVQNFRQTLFAHWGVLNGDIANWPMNSPVPGNGQVQMEALNFNHFMQPTEYRAYTSGSSWLGWYAPNIF